MDRLERRVHQFERDSGMNAAGPFRERLALHRSIFDLLSTCTQDVVHPSKRQVKLEHLSKNPKKTLDELSGSSGAAIDRGGRGAEIEEESDELSRTGFSSAVSSEILSSRTLRRRTPASEAIKELGREEISHEKEDPSVSLEILPSRLDMSPYFVDRDGDMRMLKEILRDYDSVAITGYGSLGKTQLMAAFAEHAEVDGNVPRGVFWVVANGDASRLVGSLAVVLEKLIGPRIPENDLQKPSVVLSILENFLSKPRVRFLLCLDNVDSASDPEVFEILDELCAMIDPTKSNCWVMVTSRCGRAILWPRMKECQNIELRPLLAVQGIDSEFQYLNHTVSLVNYFSSSIDEHVRVVPELSLVVDLYEFSFSCLFWIGRLKEAPDVQMNFLKLRRTIHGENAMHVDIAETLYKLGRVFQTQGKLSEAETMLLDSLFMLYSINGKIAFHADIANAFNEHGHVYQAQGRLDEGESTLRKSLDMMYSIHGSDSAQSDTATSLHYLGCLFEAQGKLDEAVVMYRKYLDMKYSIFGSNSMHPDLAESLSNLANVFKTQGKLDQAETMFREALKMMFWMYGSYLGHPALTSTRCKYENVLRAQGDEEDTIQVSNQSYWYNEIAPDHCMIRSLLPNCIMPLCSQYPG